MLINKTQQYLIINRDNPSLADSHLQNINRIKLSLKFSVYSNNKIDMGILFNLRLNKKSKNMTMKYT
jgi:hypothetical protein